MSTTINEINAKLQELQPSQLRAFHKAMQRPEFPLANESQMGSIFQFVSHLVR